MSSSRNSLKNGEHTRGLFNKPVTMISFIPSKMFSVLLVLACACFSSAAMKNDTGLGRTFVLFDHTATDEPLDPDYLDPDIDPGNKYHRKSSWRRNVSSNSQQNLSDEAVLFLTGPVSTILIPSFYTLVCVISVPINICAVVAFVLRIRPKKPAVIYMLNLACADLVFAMLLPFKITYHFQGNNWIFGPIMCSVVTVGFYWNMYCSVLLIACISVDRFLAVVYPINSLAWRTPQNAIVACLAMWIISLAGSLPLVVFDQTVPLKQLDITTCHDVQLHYKVWHYKIYFIILCCALFFLPLLVTVVSYSLVIWSLSHVPLKLPGHSRRRSRAVVMALSVLVMFMLCFMPTNCLLLTHYLQANDVKKNQETPDGSYAAYLVFMCLGSLNCLLDPLVYYFGSSQCQRQLSKALGCAKMMRGSSISNSSDSCRSSSSTMLKSSCTESSKINASLAKMDTFQANLNSQYKKLLV